MEANKDLIEPLLHTLESYCKKSLKIVELKAIEKTALISGVLISRFLLIIVLSFFMIAINIALALWLGELLGKNYYGFLLIGFFYAIIAIILFYMHPLLKQRIGNFIITQLLN